MTPFYQNLSKWFPKFSLMPGKSRLSAPSLALGLACVLLANCTPLPETLPIPPDVEEHTDIEEEVTDLEIMDITEEEEYIAEPEPTVVSHGLLEEETIVIVDDDDTGQWEADQLSSQDRAEREILLAKSQLASGYPSAAVETLLRLDSEVTGKVRLKTRKTLLQVLQSLDSLHRSLLLEDITDPNLAGWLALLEALDSEALPETELQEWRRAYPDHPAVAVLIDTFTVPGQNSWRQIALLLPLTSPDGRAARAFYDGFTEAHNNDGSRDKPELVLYDIGADSFLASFYYQAAEADGADFIVGPLGRIAVENLLASRNLETNTLLLADIPPEKASDNLYGISLSPENEARQVADKAYATGHRNAIVLRSEGEWGERTANAFIAHWENLGGQILKNSSFPEDVSNHARVVRKFLGIDKSMVRHRLIEAQTGLKLKFSPRRNTDLDFIFLAATTTQARLIVPQLRFSHAHDVPLYGTSYVYAGNPEPAMDADLDGLIFGEMRWILDGVTLYKKEKAEEKALKMAEAANNQDDSENQSTDPGALEEFPESGVPTLDVSGEVDEVDLPQVDLPQVDLPQVDLPQVYQPELPARPYGHSALDRLYALGLQSYQIIPQLRRLRQNNWMRISGKAMTVSVDQNGNAVHLPTWAKFVSGLAEPLPLLPAQ